MMVKTNQQIIYKPLIEPYIEAEWLGGYVEAKTGGTSELPSYIGSPGYIVPKTPNQSGGFEETIDKTNVFFRVTTNQKYEIICSGQPATGSSYSIQTATSSSYLIPMWEYLGSTTFIHSDSLVFIDEQSKKLSKIPNGIKIMKWMGRPSESDLSIKIDKSGKVNLGQKAIGSLFVMYYVDSDVYSVQTHYLDVRIGVWWSLFNEPRIYGIFSKENPVSTSLRLDVPAETA